MAHIRQSRPDSGLDFQVKLIATFQGVPSSARAYIIRSSPGFRVQISAYLSGGSFPRSLPSPPSPHPRPPPLPGRHAARPCGVRAFSSYLPVERPTRDLPENEPWESPVEIFFNFAGTLSESKTTFLEKAGPRAGPASEQATRITTQKPSQ